MTIEIYEVILKGKEEGNPGQVSDASLLRHIACNSRGVLYANLAGPAGAINDVSDPGDARSPTNLRFLETFSYNGLFNGTTIDRERGNIEETILASTARTASVNSADFTNYNNRGGHFVINVTSITDTPSIVPTIQGKDPISGSYYDILVGLPIVATGINILKVYPGIGAIANGAATDILPRTWRVKMTHADADSITYSVAASLDR